MVLTICSNIIEMFRTVFKFQAQCLINHYLLLLRLLDITQNKIVFKSKMEKYLSSVHLIWSVIELTYVINLFIDITVFSVLIEYLPYTDTSTLERSTLSIIQTPYDAFVAEDILKH